MNIKSFYNQVFLFSGILIFSVLTTACTPSSVTDSKVALTSVDKMLKLEGDFKPLNGMAALTHFKELNKFVSEQQHKKIPVTIYALQTSQKKPQSYVQQRATELELTYVHNFYPSDNIKDVLTESQNAAVRVVGVRNKKFELSYNLDSGSELLVNNELFHNGNGVPIKQLKPDEFYFETANRYIRKALLNTLAGTKLYPYKIRKFMDAAGKEGDEPEITVSQIAVAYNTVVDGISVIGPGGKAVVHMTPEGEVVGHETIVRPALLAIAKITGADLVEPQNAISIMYSRLNERDISVDDYMLSRSEFGYLSMGRNSSQLILAPYYAFILEPKNEKVVGRKIVEIVPAVKNKKIAQLMEEDMQRDIQRKQIIIDKAGKPDQRKN